MKDKLSYAYVRMVCFYDTGDLVFICEYYFLTHLLTYWLIRVQDDVWGNAVLLKEANAISVELKKKANLSLFCLSNAYAYALDRL